MPNMIEDLIFLKLGGSIITDKNSIYTLRKETLYRLAMEIYRALRIKQDLHLVVGHGSGSYGHYSADMYGTRKGVRTPEEWKGYTKVWRDAHFLNNAVLEMLTDADVPVVNFPPSAGAIARNGEIVHWDTTALETILQAGQIPVVMGDIVVDQTRGASIVSTEAVFSYLAPRLRPARILLAGSEPGVWEDFPACTRLHQRLTRADLSAPAAQGIGASAGVDVTGGMRGKVESMLDLIDELPGLEVVIFSGAQPGNLKDALTGEAVGTILSK